MPKLKAVVKQIEDVEEPFRGLYEQNQHGEYVLAVEEIDSHPKVRGLKTALDTTKTQREAMKGQLAPFQALIDRELEGEALQELMDDLIESLDDPTGAKGKGKGKGGSDDERLTALRTSLETKHKRELDKTTTRAQRLEKALHARLVDAELDAAIEKAGVKKELRPAVRALLKERGPKVLEAGEEFRGVFPTDFHGVPEANQSIAEYVGAWAATDDAAEYMPPQNKSGSGAPPNRGNGGSGGRKTFTQDDLSRGTFDIDALAKGEATVL